MDKRTSQPSGTFDRVQQLEELLTHSLYAIESLTDALDRVHESLSEVRHANADVTQSPLRDRIRAAGVQLPVEIPRDTRAWLRGTAPRAGAR